MNFEQVTIVGPGLLGVSLAMALRNRVVCDRIVVWARNPARAEECSKLDWCDQAEQNLEAAVYGSDMVVLCTSVESISSFIPEIISLSAEGMLVTDVGSVKTEICQAGATHGGKGMGTFVGSHPMAGSEKSGMEHARADLFEGKPCIVTPDKNTPEAVIQSIHCFWEKVGMKVHRMSAEDHDRCVAHVSHLPHLLSSSLAHCLDGMGENWQSLSGQGLRDTTRIAEGNPELWEQILLSNKPNLLAAIEELEKSVSLVKNYLKKEDGTALREFLDIGVRYRKSLDGTKE
jgi:cyclohexadieny/prephenate dehydrogenase